MVVQGMPSAFKRAEKKARCNTIRRSKCGSDLYSTLTEALVLFIFLLFISFYTYFLSSPPQVLSMPKSLDLAVWIMLGSCLYSKCTSAWST